MFLDEKAEGEPQKEWPHWYWFVGTPFIYAVDATHAYNFIPVVWPQND